MEKTLLKNSLENLEEVISRTLNINKNILNDELSYRSIKEWDSLGHINLLLQIEEEFNISIEEDVRDKLVTFADIKNIVLYNNAPTEDSLINKCDSNKISRGLANVNLDYTSISEIDGKNGRLSYRGIDIDILVENFTYEEVVYLLLYKKLPSENELFDFKNEIIKSQSLSDEIKNIILMLKDKSIFDVLQVVLVMLKSETDDLSDVNKARTIMAKFPMIIAYYYHCKTNDQEERVPSNNLSYSGNLFYLITGKIPTLEESKIIDRILILHAEHSSNASSFVARVTTSTEADFHSALVAALSAFSGCLHGGAIEGVVEMVEEIGEVSNVRYYVEDKLKRSQPIMGFGHRVYQTLDPRAKWMKDDLLKLCIRNNSLKDYRILDELTKNMKPYIGKGMDINVDFYASMIYSNLGFSKDVFLSLFATGRMAGWCAHIIEQKSNNILIRPLLKYKVEG
ncbi:citrate/2-methylcitrate synthase [Lysinibacillus xylanilyticus]|uniref:citrate/2-methylcitrate synthase n=1 Tax=Lysinibacillus xylanilyticus TaxID=582475 RepID=UPI003D035E45